MDVLEAIRSKRAVRQFRAEPLPEDAMRAILNAGRRAQSAKNTQPWRFIAVTQRETLEALSKMGQYAGHLAGAALAVVIVTPDPDSRFSVMFDAGQAAAYMQLAAWSLGIGSVPATIYEPAAAQALLGVPEGWHIRIALSFGWPADEEDLKRANKSGGRAAFDEVVQWERWGAD